MRFLIDQGIARSVAGRLTSLGHDAVHVGAIGLASARDHEILERARLDRRVVVTLDADFHALLATHSLKEPSVIRLRVQGVTSEQISSMVVAIVDVCGGALVAGAVVTSDGTRVRLRNLPIT